MTDNHIENDTMDADDTVSAADTTPTDDIAADALRMLPDSDTITLVLDGDKTIEIPVSDLLGATQLQIKIGDWYAASLMFVETVAAGRTVIMGRPMAEEDWAEFARVDEATTDEADLAYERNHANETEVDDADVVDADVVDADVVDADVVDDDVDVAGDAK